MTTDNKPAGRSKVKAGGFDDMVKGSGHTTPEGFGEPVPGIAAPDDEAAVAIISGPVGPTYITDASDLEADDVKVPRLRLAQGLTQEVSEGTAKPGDWVLLGSDPLESVTIVPLAIAKRREFRPDRDKPPVCVSPDQKQGYGDPGIECAKCPFSDWTGEKGDRKPPPCEPFYSYVAWSEDHQQLVEFTAKRTSTDAGKYINTLAKSRGLGLFAVEMGRQSQKNTRNQVFYVPTVTKVVVGNDVLERARENSPFQAPPAHDAVVVDASTEFAAIEE